MNLVNSAVASLAKYAPLRGNWVSESTCHSVIKRKNSQTVCTRRSSSTLFIKLAIRTKEAESSPAAQRQKVRIATPSCSNSLPNVRWTTLQ